MNAAGGSLGVMAVAGLLERERELEILRRALSAGAGGKGRAVMLEGSAGLGKSRLLETARELGAATGVSVLFARTEELEMALPWSLARTLLARGLEGIPASRRRRTLDSVPGGAADLLRPEWAASEATGDDAVLRLAHGLMWLTAGLAERAPLALVIDDAHWADEPSLRFVAYLTARLAELPVALVIARRPRAPGAEPGLLDRVAGHPATQVLELRPLSEPAVAQLAREVLGGVASSSVVATCARATAGNPFYLRELLHELANGRDAGTAIDAASIGMSAPAAVARSVRLRLDALGPEPLSLARAVAVLGEGAPLPHAAELARLEPARASRALDCLAASEILAADEPLRFLHPLVASAVHDDLGTGERGDWHLRAARILARHGAEPQRVAIHLLAGGRRGDPWVVRTLQAAACNAQGQGATAAAADYLARALEEPPTPEQRASVLGELGRVQSSLGRPGAAEQLRMALDLTNDRSERARLLLELGRAILVTGAHVRAASAFEAGLAELDDPASDLARELRAARWMCATLDGARADELLTAGDLEVGDDSQTPTPGQRQMLAQLAVQRALENRPPAEVAALAERAWGDGALLSAETSDGMTWSLVTGALYFAGELERDIEICDAVIADARARGSPMAYATACYCRGSPLLHRGQVNDAVADLQSAVRAREDGWATFFGVAVAALALAHIEQGALGEANRTLELVSGDAQIERSHQGPLIMIARGRLLIAEGKPKPALGVLLGAGERLRQSGLDPASMFEWRADVAFAASLAGERSRARCLAREAHAHALQSGIPRTIARALRAAAAVERGERAIARLREAVAILADAPPRLEYAHALVDLGAALRRSHRRADATPLLREGLALASAGGIHALADRARTELAAAGLRVNSARSGSGLNALTASERRVAELAAAGHSNRDIAQMLFVTVKAVEYHLANTFRKLDIRRRSQLAPLLTKQAQDEAGGQRGDRNGEVIAIPERTATGAV
jgi:DNA-binding CsgD family transcriptional regulator